MTKSTPRKDLLSQDVFVEQSSLIVFQDLDDLGDFLLFHVNHRVDIGPEKRGGQVLGEGFVVVDLK